MTSAQDLRQLEQKECIRCGSMNPVEAFRVRGKFGARENICHECRKLRKRSARYREGSARENDPQRRSSRIAQRKYKASEKGKESVLRYKWHAKISKKIYTAVSAGKLPHPSAVPCQDRHQGRCSSEHLWHHDSYAEGDELKVRCLCTKHHGEWHTKFISAHHPIRNPTDRVVEIRG